MPTFPDAPIYTYSDANKKLTWPAVTGADAYVFEYSEDGGVTWISIGTFTTLFCSFNPGSGAYLVHGCSKSGSNRGGWGAELPVNVT